MPLLPGLPSGQLLGSFPGTALGLQQGQQLYSSQLTPAAYPTLPTQMAYQVPLSLHQAALSVYKPRSHDGDAISCQDKLQECYLWSSSVHS